MITQYSYAEPSEKYGMLGGVLADGLLPFDTDKVYQS